MKIAIQTTDFDVSIELAKLRAMHRDIGAIVSFIGTVREMSSGRDVSQMELEHYPGMTEKALKNIVQQAMHRWKINDVAVVHRIGVLLAGEQIVLVAVAGQHRKMAFEACEFIIDYLKTEAPFWKKETSETGAQWVDARESDLDALQKWSDPQIAK